MANILHSSESAEWYTPVGIVERARVALGGVIDVDPCGNARTNEIIKAKRYITRGEDGLTADWGVGSAFVNPPGGRGSVAKWWDKAVEFHRRDERNLVVFVLFNINSLQVLQNKSRKPPTDYVICIPRKRIAYLRADGSVGRSPPQASAIVCLAPYCTSSDVFGSIGSVVRRIG